MVAASYTWPVDREEIRRRLAHLPPLEDLLTADDLEKQRDNARALLRPAAVLLLIVNRAEGATVVFTQRTTSLPAHAGQISCPGGRCEEGDAARATRRCAIEGGRARPARVEVWAACLVQDVHGLPRTDRRLDRTADRAEPIPPRWPMSSVPLASLLDPSNHRHESAYCRGGFAATGRALRLSFHLGRYRQDARHLQRVLAASRRISADNTHADICLYNKTAYNRRLSAFISGEPFA